VTWVRNLMNELGHEQTSATPISQDNTGSISWAKGVGNFRKNKHVDIKIHHVRELIRKKMVKVPFVPTSETLADMTTKPLFGPKFASGRKRLGLHDVQDQDGLVHGK
jgi:hypothetical protein